VVAPVAGEDFEHEHGDGVRDAEKELYGELIGEVVPLPCAGDLISRLQDRGCRVVLASSAKKEEVEHYVGLLGAEGIAYTTAADVEATKPHPDLVYAALERAGGSGDEAFLIGDSTWDCEAALRADVRTVVGLLTGGFSRQELLEAGAEVVYRDLAEMLQEVDRWAPPAVSRQP
jgi:HAD superfamily hydrolase (TIGR01549 family)